MRPGEFYEDDKGNEYYRSRSGKVYDVTSGVGEGMEPIPTLPETAEILLMTNGGIYPIIARRIEKSEGGRVLARRLQ